MLDSMTLKEYVQDVKARRQRLAASTGVAVESLDRIRAGHTASLRVALKVHKHTVGKVSALSMLNDDDRALLEEFYRGI